MAAILPILIFVVAVIAVNVFEFGPSGLRLCPQRWSPAERNASGGPISLALADGGYDVAVHYRGSPDEANVTVADIEARGRRAAAVRADLADESAVRALPAQAAASLGAVTLLVNSASIFHDDRFGELERETWDAHMQTNLRAPLVLAEALVAALPASVPDGEACIVNLIDQRVLKPNPQFFSYALSKAGLWNATRMMAQALAPPHPGQRRCAGPHAPVQPSGRRRLRPRSRRHAARPRLAAAGDRRGGGLSRRRRGGDGPASGGGRRPAPRLAHPRHRRRLSRL